MAKKKQPTVVVPKENPKRKVAIVRARDIEYSTNYGDDYYRAMLAHSIFDWTEVTEEQYNILMRNSWRASKDGFHYMVIEQLTSIEVINTIDEYLAYIAIEEEQTKQRKKQEEKAKAERDEKKRRKALDKLAKDNIELRKVYEELKAQFGDTNA